MFLWQQRRASKPTTTKKVSLLYLALFQDLLFLVGTLTFLPQCGNYRNLLSNFFDKNFVKATFSLKNTLKSWYHATFLRWEAISCFARHYDPFWNFDLLTTMWKNEKFTLIEKIFREIKSLETSLANTLLSRKFGQKSAIVNFRNFNTVFWLYSAPNYWKYGKFCRILPHKILLSDKLPGVWHKTFPEFFVAKTLFRQITVTKENYLAVL